jgi:hypothetical protein
VVLAIADVSIRSFYFVSSLAKCGNWFYVFAVFNGCSRDSSVGIVMGYGLDGQGSIPVSKTLFSPATTRLLSPVPQDSFPRGYSSRSVQLTTYIWCRGKEWWRCTSTHVFIAWCLINEAQGQLYTHKESSFPRKESIVRWRHCCNGTTGIPSCLLSGTSLLRLAKDCCT